jgi:hypothetical protein
MSLNGKQYFQIKEKRNKKRKKEKKKKRNDMTKP